eukprot:1660793-Rhodomonas_salina.1
MPLCCSVRSFLTRCCRPASTISTSDPSASTPRTWQRSRTSLPGSRAGSSFALATRSTSREAPDPRGFQG